MPDVTAPQAPDREPAPGNGQDAVRPPVMRVSRLFPLADALLAAAHADQEVKVEESEAIRRALCKLLEVDQLPDRLEQRLAAFNPANVDIGLLAQQLTTSPVVGRKVLIELTGDICRADGDIDLAEDRYVLALALALSLEPHEYAHVVFDSPFRGWRRLMKRVQDAVLATLFLAVCAPVMMVIALVVKLTSAGPVLFRQRRHGENGTEFDVLKFRTMTVMENDASVVQAQRHDPRITRVGNFLRRSSLDELPQFVNVLKGEMSIVGPRPHALAHNRLYRTKITEYMRRHKVKPGLTGWAQVNGLRGETDRLEKMVARVDHDLEYIRTWSLWLDIKIIFLTIFGRKVRRNAY
jgi:putative colanic acid biosynthesis UDP-glucose lipid carrier transferase